MGNTELAAGSAPPGFFALGRLCGAWCRANEAPVTGRGTLAAEDASECNALEAYVLGWLAFVTWVAALEALLPGMHWAIRLPVAIAAAFLLIQVASVVVALVLQKSLVSKGYRSADTVRAWHTRGHILLLVVMSGGLLVSGVGGLPIRLLAWIWLALFVANTVAALRETVGQLRSPQSSV